MRVLVPRRLRERPSIDNEPTNLAPNLDTDEWIDGAGAELNVLVLLASRPSSNGFSTVAPTGSVIPSRNANAHGPTTLTARRLSQGSPGPTIVSVR